MSKLISYLYHHPLTSRLFPTLVTCLQQELKDCRSVLDLGCGPDSPLQHCPWITDSLGVEPYRPYLKRSQAKHIHSRYLCRTIQKLRLAPKSFDAVILIEVLEHLTPEDGLKVIDMSSSWAKKKVIITSPNGFIPQKALDGNPLQQHLSGWDLAAMKRLGFVSRGLAGLKVLRQENQSSSMADDLTASIRFKPKLLWFVLAALSQALTFRLPALAFELFSVKYVKKH